MKITPKLKHLIKEALKEDYVQKDLTTLGLGFRNRDVKAIIFARQEGVLAGLDVAQQAFRVLGRIEWRTKFEDGQHFKNGDKIAFLKSKAGVILGAERVALNFLSHLSGVATFTNKFVQVVSPSKIRIYDTRKTIPLLRDLEKYAVKMGGGFNHRINLSGSLMIKDNHINVFRKDYSGADYIVQMVNILRKKYPKKELILEIRNLSEWNQALEASPDVVMFDNWDPEDIEIALRMLNNNKFETEISGSVHLKRLERIVSLGIDRISLGCITHSAPAVDFSLEIV